MAKEKTPVQMAILELSRLHKRYKRPILDRILDVENDLHIQSHIGRSVPALDRLRLEALEKLEASLKEGQ